MRYAHRLSRASACEEKAKPAGPDLVACYARICADPLVWPLTAQVPTARHPGPFKRWFRRLVRPRG